MKNSVKRSIFYWVGTIIYLIGIMNIYSEIGEVSSFMLINLILIYISGGVIFTVTVGKNRNVQKFFAHDLKRECECPPENLPKMSRIKKKEVGAKDALK